MIKLFLRLALVLTVGASSAGAQSADDQYVGIYNLVQQADGLAATQPAQALTKYLAAQTSLQRLQKLNPDWNPKVVNFRLDYLAGKISELPNANPQPTVPVVEPTPAKPESMPPPPVPETKRIPASEAEQQIHRLQDDLRRLHAEKAILEAKVREALATQPAAIDPRELVKAQDRIQSLLKENELLKASPGPKPGPLTPAVDLKELEESKRALADASRKLAEQSERASALGTEKEALQKRLAILTAETEGTNSPARLRQALDDASRKLAEQTAIARRLASEQEAMKLRVGQLSARAEVAEAFRAENDLLKQQLAQTKRAAAPTSQVEETSRRSAEAESRLAALQSDAEVLRLEKSALESRLKSATSHTAQLKGSREADQQRILQLEAERDVAQQKLAALSKESQPGANQELTARVEKSTQEIAGLRARLDVFEAQAVPYSAEELALFKQSAPQPITAESAGGKKLIQQLPPGTTALAAQAQRHFAAREFDQAEAKYHDILRQDEKNTAVLANLARVQIENHHLEEAEKSIRLALTAAPDDGYSLFILGYLKLQQEKYHEALGPLSHAVKVNPNSAEIQNCLGVALSHEGLRGPAETAFRKAIYLEPAYGNAHNNLAVMYAEQTPPLLELARWHYQKALVAGQSKNPNLEKILEPSAAAPVK